MDIQPIFDARYRRGRYWLHVPDKIPGPPLSDEEAKWVRERMATVL